jgi:hypothetical protein
MTRRNSETRNCVAGRGFMLITVSKARLYLGAIRRGWPRPTRKRYWLRRSPRMKNGIGRWL